MNSVRVRRTLAKCLVVLVAGFVLNLISPVVIAQQRTIHPGESTVITYDGPAELVTTLSTEKGPKSGHVVINAVTTLDGTELADSYTVHASTALPVIYSAASLVTTGSFHTSFGLRAASVSSRRLRGAKCGAVLRLWSPALARCATERSAPMN